MWALLTGGSQTRDKGCLRAHRLCPHQELEQQLMMEQRNYRKTVKFHQKLLQKEKRNKGSGGRVGGRAMRLSATLH